MQLGPVQLFFQAVKRVVAGSLVFDAIRRGVALYSPHTALDVADSGTNDMLADAIGLPAKDRAPLRLAQTKASQYKLVTFVPEKDVERVSAVLFVPVASPPSSRSRTLRPPEPRHALPDRCRTWSSPSSTP
jgi:hypothetical protein